MKRFARTGINYLRIGADNQKTFDYTTVVYNAEEQKYETKVLGTGIVFCQQVAKNLLENKRKSELFNSEEDKTKIILTSNIDSFNRRFIR